MIKLKTKVVIVLLFVFQLSLFAYNITLVMNENLIESINNITEFKSSNILNEPNSEPTFENITSLFNERGFYNSNSFTTDENEIINDFSGNLQLSFPLYQLKGQGDINLNLSLNYNGSMSYTSLVSPPSTGYQNTLLSSLNFTAPGWVFSLNGMGIQMLNFQDKWFTSYSGSEISDANVSLLANGYHLTDFRKDLPPADEIMILLGDGSVTTLKNISSPTEYVGEYYSNNKKNYIRAYVYFKDFIIDSTFMASNLRIMKVRKGDGLEYYYEEFEDNYYDYKLSNSGFFNRPQTFYLTKISDRFGNFVSLDYGTTSNPYYGRKVLQNIFTSWGKNSGVYNITFSYNSNFGVVVNNNYYGKYRIYTDNWFQGSKRPNIQKIEDPVGRETNISNMGYERSVSNVKYGQLGSSNNVTVKLTSSYLKRVSSFTNYKGGLRSYTYFGGNNPKNYALYEQGVEGEYYFIAGDPANYKGQGRDPFYTNMLSSVEYKLNNETYRSLNIGYEYNYMGKLSYNLDPVCEVDDYSTTFTYTQPGGIPHYTPTPSSMATEKEYKIFQLVGTFGAVSGFDYSGEIKLVSETQYSNSTAFRNTTFEFESELAGSSSTDGNVYEGSFLDTDITITELPSNAFKKYSHEYTYFENFPQDNEFDNPVKSIKTKDPLGNYTFVEYISFLDTSLYYPNAIYLGPNSSYALNKMLYYKFGDVLLYEVKDSKDNLLAKTTNEFISGNESSLGYMGQLIDTKNYNYPGFSAYLQTSNQYFKHDSSGYYLYNNTYTLMPGIEGNLKSTFDYKNNKTSYYYHPITRSEEFQHGTPQQSDFQGYVDIDDLDSPFQPPQISYYIANENGTFTLVSSLWQDTRLPTRIDNEVYSGYSIKNYLQYEPNGNPFKTVSTNSCVSNYYYDPLARVTSVILPYDFNNSEAYLDTIMDTIYYQIDSTFKADHAGYIQSFSPMDTVIWDHNIINYNLNYTYQNSVQSYSYPLFTFPITNLVYDSTVFAYFEFYPSCFINTAPLKVEFAPIHQYSISGKSVSFGTQRLEIDTLNTWDYVSNNCTTIIANIESFYDTVDIKSFINPSFKGIGITVNSAAVQEIDDPEAIYTSIINIGKCLQEPEQNPFNWARYRPRLVIKSVQRDIKARIIKIYPRSTLRYIYDDPNKSVEIRSKIEMTSSTTQRDKKSQHFFDGFNRLEKSKIFTTSSAFDSLQFEYNYLDLRSKSIDARNNETQFFYDAYLNNAQTKFESNDSSLLNNSYQTSLTNYFDTINNFVNVQEFVDENGKTFLKYFDAVGNLRREVKFTEYDENDPDSENPLENLIHMYTDYDYDDLYRLIAVRTPNGKNITYSYDGYGRVSQRITPDAGISQYKYDKNGNLTYSRDQNQINDGNNYWTFRDYDGLNRMTGLGTVVDGSAAWDNVDGEEQYQSDNPNDPYEDHLLINIYDTTDNAPSDIFTAPSNYGTNNMTKGNLVATAYKTSKLDPWNLKYYRYDARGRVVKMWHNIDGLPNWKEVDYTFNSADLPAFINYQPTKYDGKLYQYLYDDAARLNDVKIYTGGIAPEDPVSESPWLFESFSSYSYNQNSQLLSQQFAGVTSSNYSYNNRNWITSFDNGQDLFDYNLTYFANGNIETQELSGDYTDLLNDKTQLVYEYKYDKSNRLLRADQESSSGFSVWNSYDKDGNILTLKRHDVGGSLEDNFSYLYITNTNKLKRVSGSVDQFYYDGNGNMIADSLNGTFNISYDHRNLIVQLYYKRYVDEGLAVVMRTFSEFYKYDDAGNRIKKIVMKYTGTAQDPTIEDSGDAPPNWNYEFIQHYVRDVGGNELAVYNDTTVTFWNVYGIDNAGRINYSDNSWNYYLKDHLGTPRVVIDQNGDIISAEDLDMWGYRMADRSFQSDTTFYKYTGKERDVTTGYDYFGARYYDSRIGRWGQVEPLLEKYFSLSPYCYGANNPISFIDINGKDIDFSGLSKEYRELLIKELKTITGINSLFYNSTTGMLDYDRSQKEFTGGSKTSRDMILKGITNSQINISVIIDETKSTFTDGLTISLNPNEWEKSTVYGGLSDLAWGMGIVAIHEFIHTGVGLLKAHPDPELPFGQIDAIVEMENQIRKELGIKDFGQRLSYNDFTFQDSRGKQYSIIPLNQDALTAVNNMIASRNYTISLGIRAQYVVKRLN